MERICKYSADSPLCNNHDMFDKFKKISEDRWVDFGLMVWMSYSESHIWVNYAPTPSCGNTHNRAWMKRWRYDDGSYTKKYDKQYASMPEDQRNNVKGCYLYNFDSPEEFWINFANTLKYGYIQRWGVTPEVISKYRVWSDRKVKPERVYRVKLFIK